jgi:hypothetical protein
VTRSAQDDDFVGVLRKNIQNKLVSSLAIEKYALILFASKS